MSQRAGNVPDTSNELGSQQGARESARSQRVREPAISQVPCEPAIEQGRQQ